MKLSADVLREEILYSDDVVEDVIEDQRRWTTLHRIVFRRDGKLWEAYYEVPSTENSGDFSDINYDGIDAYEVESYEVTTTKYRKVSHG